MRLFENVMVVKVSDLQPNEWNPNQQYPALYEKVKESIKRYGFLAPVLVRPLPNGNGFQIVDGEHRWRAARDLGLEEITVINHDELDAQAARELTLVMNELRGRHEPQELSALLKDLEGRGTDLSDLLPYTDEHLEALLQLSEGFQWPDDVGAQEPGDGSEEQEQAWLQVSFRLRQEIVPEVMAVVSRVEQERECSPGEALEHIVMDWNSARGDGNA